MKALMRIDETKYVYHGRNSGTLWSLPNSMEKGMKYTYECKTVYFFFQCETFPLSVVDASKSACSAAHSKYEMAWCHMLPSQQ